MVLGYAAPDDGGGGMFYYANDGAATDGATVFAYDQDIGPEQSSDTVITSIDGTALGANVAWGTVSLEFDTVPPVTLTDIHLHGHATDNNTVNPIADGFGRLDYTTGILTDRGDTVQNTVIGQAGVGSIVTIKRKLLTNTRRWRRLIPEKDVFHLKWTGAVSGADISGHQLSWAINSAKRQGFAIVDLDWLEVAQSGIIEIPMNMTLRHGIIKTRGNDWAVKALRTTPPYDFNDPEYFVDQMQPWVSGANSSDGSGVSVTLEELELDGNIAGNQDALLNPSNYNDVENNLQNSPWWSGFSWMNQNSRVMPDNSFCYITNCHFHDFGSNCLLGYFSVQYQTLNLRLGNSARNHLWYQTMGVHTGLYMYGFAWGTYSKCEGIKVAGCTIEQLVFNPYFVGADVIWNYEGDDYSADDDEVRRTDYRPGAFWQNVTIKIEDGKGPIGRCFGWLGQNIHFEKITLITAKDNNVTVFGQVANQFQNALNRNITIKDVTVISRNGPNFRTVLCDTHLADNMSIENVSFFVRYGFTPPDKSLAPQGQFMTLEIPDVSQLQDPAWPYVRTASLRGFTSTGGYGLGPVRLLDIESLATEPVKFTVENGVSRVASCLFVTTQSNSGNTDLWTNNNPEKFEGTWRNVSFDNEDFSGFNMRAILFTARRLENVTMKWTTVVTQQLFSEELIRIDQDFTGLTELDIQTVLWWVPKSLSNIVVLPRNTAAATALNGAIYTFRDRSNTQTIEWEDLVTSGAVDYRAPILRITTQAPVAAGNLEFDVSLRIV